MNEYERFKNLVENENSYILIDDELYLIEIEKYYIRLTNFEDEKVIDLSKDNFKDRIENKKIFIVIILEDDLENYLEEKTEVLEYQSNPVEYIYQDEEIKSVIDKDDESDIFTEIVEIDIENLIKIDLEIKERILSEWERTYSDLEYMDSIENNYKNMFPKMNEYQTYDKSMKLLNFIYNKTKINGYDNYLSKQDVIIKHDDNYENAYKYLRDELNKITGASFSPYNFSENNKKLVILINGKKQEIILNQDIQTIEVAIENIKFKDVICNQYNKNIQLLVKKDKIINLSYESDPEAILLFGKLICYKPIIKDIANNDFTQSYLLPIIQDKKKFYGDTKLIDEDTGISDYVDINEYEFQIIDAKKKKKYINRFII